MTEINLPSSNNTCVKCNATKRTFTAYTPGSVCDGKIIQYVCASLFARVLYMDFVCVPPLLLLPLMMHSIVFSPRFFQCQKYSTRIAWTIKFRNEPQILYLWETASRASACNSLSLSTFLLFAYVSEWVSECIPCACVFACVYTF